MDGERYDVVAVGTGFATSFFVYEFLRHAGPEQRVLVLERGARRSHAERIEERDRGFAEGLATYVNATETDKQWLFSMGVGGSSQCWWGNTPRMLPADFETATRYGVGVDWPLRYDDLEESYCQAEELMHVAGPETSPFPRSRPYPQPAHRLSRPDRVLQKAFPQSFFAVPTARPTRNVPGGRPACCGASVCGACPIDSKFTILNGFGHVYDDARVELRVGANVQQIETQGEMATGVRYRGKDGYQTVAADLVVLGANALFNPYLLLRSGLEGPEVGRGLCEQVSENFVVLLDGLDNFQGSTSITGHGYNFYDGEHRRTRGAALIETFNRPELRKERGKWLQLLRVKAVIEDLRQARNRVTDSGVPEKPKATYAGHSDYAERGRVAMVQSLLDEFLEPLPVEKVMRVRRPVSTEAHIMGTTVMGSDPERSVVDATSVHHRLRNLVVLGSGTFPTSAPANPTLTLCALALYSARKLFA